MKVVTEAPEESRDFGNSPTIKIQAFKPRDIFCLGLIRMECVKSGSQVVHSETSDGKGMFLRLPLLSNDKVVTEAPEESREVLSNDKVDPAREETKTEPLPKPSENSDLFAIDVLTPEFLYKALRPDSWDVNANMSYWGYEAWKLKGSLMRLKANVQAE